MLVLFDVFCIAFFLALVLTPSVRDYSKRWGLVDHPDEHRKTHAQPIPRLGGVAIALSYICTLAFVVVAPYKNLPFDVQKAVGVGYGLLPPIIVIFITGLLDDIHGLKPWQKLTGQTIAGIWAYYAGCGITVFHGTELDVWLALPVTVIWLVGCTNALNLIDGMDGLATGVGIFAATTTLVAALIHGSVGLALVTVPLVGALAGFLRYNFNPASIFLGDSGSLLVGFLLGCYGILWSQKSATILGMTAPLMAMAIPLLEVALSVARRFLRHQPLFEADRGHIHHRLLAQGMTPRRAALSLYLVCGAAATFSLLQDVAHSQVGGLIIVLFCAVAWIGVQHLGYAEFGMAGRLMFRGTLRGIINVQLRIQEFETSIAASTSLEDLWETLSEGCLEFGFSGVRLSLPGFRFQQNYTSGSTGPELWHLQIPLADGRSLSLFRTADASMHPITLTLFGQIARRVLDEKLPGLLLAPVLPPPQPEARLAPEQIAGAAVAD